jgi:hypothetical protein
MTPKLSDLAAYCANLATLLRDLPEVADLRVELGRAVEELRTEIKAQRKRAA